MSSKQGLRGRQVFAVAPWARQRRRVHCCEGRRHLHGCLGIVGCGEWLLLDVVRMGVARANEGSSGRAIHCGGCGTGTGSVSTDTHTSQRRES